VTNTGYGECGAGYAVNFAVKAYSARWAALDELRSRIWYTAHRHGLRMVFPRLDGAVQERYGEMGSTPAAETVWDKLAAVTALQALPEAEVRELAGRGVLQRYARHERVIREGESSAMLYLVIEGALQLSTIDKSGTERDVARLGPGEFVGLLQVMLRQPSPFSAEALTDLLLVVIPGDAANRLLERSPHLARDFGHALEARRQAVTLAKEGRTARISAKP
jgi:hypothetical protein